jgi:hypothetical protein
MIEFNGHSHQQFGHISYSQHGEDLFFMNLVKFLKLEKPSYLDCGAYHPKFISNTHLLYLNGARGINVEPNERYTKEWLEERPYDVTLYLAIGIENGPLSYYIENDTSVLNSTIKESFKSHNTNYTKIEKKEAITINRIIETYWDGKFPDFLMTDLEGLDLAVLENADFSKTKPKIICSEISQKESIYTKMVMLNAGYAFLCRIGSNLIFVDFNYYHLCI